MLGFPFHISIVRFRAFRTNSAEQPHAMRAICIRVRIRYPSNCAFCAFRTKSARATLYPKHISILRFRAFRPDPAEEPYVRISHRSYGFVPFGPNSVEKPYTRYARTNTLPFPSVIPLFGNEKHAQLAMPYLLLDPPRYVCSLRTDSVLRPICLLTCTG
jgi:hypothetical protein